MQSYGNPGSGYPPYYGQHIYQQQQQQQHPHHQQHPPHPPPQQYGHPAPTNAYSQFNYQPYIPPNRDPPFIPTTATPRPKAHRRTATTPSAPQPKPLKPALKKRDTIPPRPEVISRINTYPAPYAPPSERPRPRLPPDIYNTQTSEHNHEEFRPLHMFMMLTGNNELRLENIMDPAMRELRTTILPMWPDGIESDYLQGHDWTVRFRNNPWAFQGPNAPKAWKIIVQLFTLFARRGFSFQTSMNISTPSPRLVFEVSSEDRTSHFFLAYFSQGGRRLTLIKPPPIVDDTLGSQLKAYLPRKITEESVDDNIRVIQVRKLGAPGLEFQFFLMHVLKVLSEIGFNLVTSIPLGRKGPLGLRVAKELLVFRGTGPPDLN